MSAAGCAPYPPARATEIIRGKASDPCLTLAWTNHARERLMARGLLMGDVLHVLSQGFVYDPGEPTTRQGFICDGDRDAELARANRSCRCHSPSELHPEGRHRHVEG
jgi:hypothetical protein